MNSVRLIVCTVIFFLAFGLLADTTPTFSDNPAPIFENTYLIDNIGNNSRGADLTLRVHKFAPFGDCDSSVNCPASVIVSGANGNVNMPVDVNVRSLSVGKSPVIDGGGKWVGSPTGLVGPQGPQGVKGDTGAQGIQGVQGGQGLQGIQGPEGPQGVQGLKGDKGEIGSSGVQGPRGEPGAAGPLGLKGDTGAQGPRGLAGAQGPQGAKGDSGSAGPQGPKGDTGANGAQGPRGDTGAMGPQGLKGETGTSGSKGEAGPQGIQGSKGDKGDKGLKGDKGDSGDSCTISESGIIKCGNGAAVNVNGPKGAVSSCTTREKGKPLGGLQDGIDASCNADEILVSGGCSVSLRIPSMNLYLTDSVPVVVPEDGSQSFYACGWAASSWAANATELYAYAVCCK